MQLQTAISCVNYDDFLALTLPHNLPFLESVTVLTSPRDTATIGLAKRLGVQLFISDAWHTGGPLNKALALNQWLTHASAYEPEAWLLTLDADVLLFQSVPACLASLDRSCLYGVHRRLCETPAELDGFFSGRRPLDGFPLDLVRMIQGKLWGTVSAVNPVALSGYFQLWNPDHSVGAKSFSESGTAEAYDLAFGLSFPETSRVLLDQEVLHLGPTEINWTGRRSSRWDFAGPSYCQAGPTTNNPCT